MEDEGSVAPDTQAEVRAPRSTAADDERRRVRRGWGCVGAGLTGFTGFTLLALAAIGSFLSSLTFEGCEGVDVGPGDGKDSAHLPVDVAPTTGLRDGSTVFVTSTAFTPGRIVGITMCLSEAGVERAGVDACDTDAGLRVAVPPDGAIRVAYAVPRVITVDGMAHDCAAAAERCILVAADARDYTQSGGRPLTFAEDLPEVPIMAAGPRTRSVLLPGAVEPTGPVADGATVTATASDFLPDEPLLVGLCSSDFLSREVWEACVPADDRIDVISLFMGGLVAGDPHRADADGRATVTVQVDEDLDLGSGPVPSFSPAASVDCAHSPGRCGVVIAAAADTQRSAYLPLTVSG